MIVIYMNNDMQKDTIDFLEKNKEFLQVEDIDGGKRVTFNNLGETEIVDDIVVGKFRNAISLPNNLKDGKYLIYDNDNQKYYIANVLNQHINGEGKEYDENGNIIFEGEYKNDKRNGKGEEYNPEYYSVFVGTYKEGEKVEGKEYNSDKTKLLFIGEYKNNKWHGKGKEYDENENLIFEGEYKNDKRNGKGKKYDENGKVIFEGEYKDDTKNGEGKEYDENGRVIFEGEYKNGVRWNGKGKIYIQTKNGYIEKECDYDKGKKNGYGVIEKSDDDEKSVRVRKYHDNKAVEESLYVNGEECSKVKLTEGSYVHTDSTKTNYEDTNVVVYNLIELSLNDIMHKIRDKFGEKTQFLTQCDVKDEPNEDIKIAEGTDKLELFINQHGVEDLEAHPIYLHDIRPISNKVSNAIVGSKGQIKTLTIKLVNCYGRTYDLQGNDLKAEILKDIYTKAVEKAKEEIKTLDLNTLPTILISGATIDSGVIAKGSTNETKKGCKRMAKKEYFLFDKKDWKNVAKIMEKQNKSNENTIIKKIDSKIAVENNIKEYRGKNKELIDLFKETKKEEYRKLKGYYNNRNNIDNEEPKEIETKKENNIGGV